MKKLYLFIMLFLLASQSLFAQAGIQIGKDPTFDRRGYGGGFYDYSEPDAVNIKVSVWGFVRFPGKYLIPDYSNARDLLSYAGGPVEDAKLHDIRLYRVTPDNKQEFIKLNYNDLVWEDNLKNTSGFSPKVQVGDILIIPGEPRYYYKDYLQMGLSIVSTLISITILILNITK